MSRAAITAATSAHNRWDQRIAAGSLVLVRETMELKLFRCADGPSEQSRAGESLLGRKYRRFHEGVPTHRLVVIKDREVTPRLS